MTLDELIQKHLQWRRQEFLAGRSVSDEDDLKRFGQVVTEESLRPLLKCLTEWPSYEVKL